MSENKLAAVKPFVKEVPQRLLNTAIQLEKIAERIRSGEVTALALCFSHTDLGTNERFYSSIIQVNEERLGMLGNLHLLTRDMEMALLREQVEGLRD